MAAKSETKAGKSETIEAVSGTGPAKAGTTSNWPMLELVKDDFWIGGKRRKAGERGRWLCLHDAEVFVGSGVVKVVTETGAPGGRAIPGEAAE